MSVAEFQIIEKYFKQLTQRRQDVHTTIGDDCALLMPETDKLLAVSTDTLVAGTHFFADTDPYKLGHKSLAVNLSDLAAMGANPCWVSLSLTLPEVNEPWLDAFSKGFASLASRFNVQLIGGDITKGPLSITITLQGQVEPDKALTRSGARAGDLVFVSGQLGSAALALKKHSAEEPQHDEALEKSLLMPEPRINLGLALSGLASACIDISDGLIADLGHICTASECGAQIHLEKIPCHNLVADENQRSGNFDLALSGGDDYELCFTIPPSSISKLDQVLGNFSIEITEIGEITASPGVEVLDMAGELIEVQTFGFTHFQ